MNRAHKQIFFWLSLATLMTLVSALLYLFSREAPLNHQKQLNSGLIAAIHAQNTKEVVGLLEQGANPDARGAWDKGSQWGETWDQIVGKPRSTSDGPTALMLGVFTGRIEMVHSLLDKGANVNARDKEGNTALMYAGLYGRSEDALLLLDHGADANPNKYGEDPLVFIIESGDANLIRRLLARGTKINKQDSSGNTPLLTAASRADVSTVRLLLEKGADVNACDTGGRTPLLRAVNAGSNLESVVVSSSDQIATVRILLQKAPNTNIQDKAGHTALQIANTRSLSKIIELLKAAGAKR